MTKQATYGLLLYPNMLDYVRSLCPEDSEPAMLLAALTDLRFHGADPAEIRSNLSGYNVVVFDMISYRLMKNMKSYKDTCDQRSDSSIADTNVVGGGMILHDDMLRTLAFAAEGTEVGAYFDALYQVHSGLIDPDAVESTLPRGAKLVFMMTRNTLFGEPTKKLTRSEINRQNALKRWNKKAPKEAAEEQPEAARPVLPPEVADISCMLDAVQNAQSEQVTELMSNDVSFEVGSGDADTPADNVPATVVTEAIAVNVEPTMSAESISNKTTTMPCENANGCKSDANSISHPPYNKNKTNNKNKTHPYTPTISYRGQGGELNKLQEEFDCLWQAYPKHEDRERSWEVFRRLDPDGILLANIHEGLHIAQQQDKRFRGEYRYIPTLRNWLLSKGWLAENIHRIEDPTGRHVNYTSGAIMPISYSQRPYPSETTEDERAMRALAVLRERYGDTRD